LEEKPVPELRMPSIDLNQVGETVESRLTQAQQFVFNFWRGGEKAEASRPERTGPIMNHKWWFWNILLMSVPGTLLGLYCEFKAKPEMHEMLGKLDEEQRKRIMGAGFEFDDKEESISVQEEMSTEDTIKAQAIDEELESEESLSLMALKRRLDAFEFELKKKDRQLDHLRKYQIERSQQSGIQNRVEDRMIEGWKSQQKPSTETVDDDTDKDTSLSERMKLAVMQGMTENLKTKKADMDRIVRQMVNRARGIVAGEDVPTSSPESPGSDDEDINEHLVSAVEASTSHTTRAAETISSSVTSSDPKGMARAAKEAPDAAIEASRAAPAAAEAVPDKDKECVSVRTWKSWFRKARPETGEDSKPSE
jgi:hypothetical protein